MSDTKVEKKFEKKVEKKEKKIKMKYGIEYQNDGERSKINQNYLFKNDADFKAAKLQVYYRKMYKNHDDFNQIITDNENKTSLELLILIKSFHLEQKILELKNLKL